VASRHRSKTVVQQAVPRGLQVKPVKTVRPQLPQPPAAALTNKAICRRKAPREPTALRPAEEAEAAACRARAVVAVAQVAALEKPVSPAVRAGRAWLSSRSEARLSFKTQRPLSGLGAMLDVVGRGAPLARLERPVQGLAVLVRGEWVVSAGAVGTALKAPVGMLS
jgi:hypothetical protein